MYYVYVLYLRGIPIYAGMTNKPLVRYKQHYYEYCSSVFQTARYNLMAFDRYLEMRLVYRCENKGECIRMESIAIISLQKAGFHILNGATGPIYFKGLSGIKRLPVRWLKPYIVRDIIKQIKEYDQ